MDLLKEKYIILELIPTGINKEKGNIIQLSALKLSGLNLLDRFDYRLNEELIEIEEFKEIINYDKSSFIYKDSTEEILSSFEKWTENLPLLILDNTYTNNFLKDIPNTKHSICTFLDLEYQDDIIEKIITKYNLEPSNYIVDLLYEALIKHL